MSGYAVTEGVLLKDNTKAITPAAPLEAMEHLVAEHSGMVFRIAYSILRNHHDAEDAVQECFLKALKYGKDLGHVRSPKTWLGRIAWTVALDRRALQNRSGPAERGPESDLLEQLPDARPGQDDQLAGQQMRRLLERMIASLPEDLRHPLELSTVQELNSAEIAELMGIPEGSVRTRLLRARKILKEKLSSMLEAKHG
ncbi:MAG TPA: RNA polymerase sigma factor [Candidatus Saccharimonadales bacterium]|nr:RNA polymerase sigma factor [Candidatus Saccharimonadales bacterium]